MTYILIMLKYYKGKGMFPYTSERKGLMKPLGFSGGIREVSGGLVQGG